MIRPICKDREILQSPSRKAVKKDLRLVRDLKDTLAAHSGCVGLAADMIGENVQMLAAEMMGVPVVMVNPVILMKKDPYVTEEGCLSHDHTSTVTRYGVIEVEYRDDRWNRHRSRLEGLPAQIVQHEMDHFEGKLV